jgi:hypothetical protein
MVLVSAKPYNDIGILQTERSNRERHEARGVGHEAIPLEQHIIGCHGEREACLERRPDPVHDLLEGEQGDAGDYAATGISSI